MDKGALLTAIRVASATLVVVAIVVQVASVVGAGAFNPTRFFAYFTIQSNMIGVVAFALLIANANRPRSRGVELLRGAAAVYLTITFFVVIFLLSGVDVGLQVGWVDFILHKLFPVVAVLDWIVDPPTRRLAYRDAVVWIVYPLVWLVLTVLRGALDGWYPYPFLDPANGGGGAVALTSVAVAVAFFVISLAYIVIGRYRQRQPAVDDLPV